MPQSMPEYALTRNYLELMVELPWNKSTTGECSDNTCSCSLIVSQDARANSAEILPIDYLSVVVVHDVNCLETELVS